jgi:peptidoglycan hydrolase-like protein with peptidoglycan-binding domain
MWYIMALLTTQHMKKTTFLSVLLGIALLSGATVAQAQTYIYPLTPTLYPNTPAYPGSPILPACVTFTEYQQLGSSDSYTSGQVTALQQLLNREGYLSGVTGYFDQGTFGAVVNFQRAHGLFTTGTVGPLTRAALSQESCGNGYNPVVPPVYLPPVVPQPPVYVPPVNNCSWASGIYQCSAPSYPVNCPYLSSGYYPYGCVNGVTLNSFTTTTINPTNSYNGNITSVTLQGSGFSPNGNTVHFDAISIPSVSSVNGSSITFNVPSGYYAGSYPITVTNAQGFTSNALTFTMTTNNCYTYSPYNNCTPYYPGSTTLSLSGISGSTSVQAGMNSYWTVTATDANNQNVTVTTNWGDGSSNDVQSSYGSTRTFNLWHTYYTSGTYTVRVTATDSNGFTAYSSIPVTVSGYTYGRPY